MRIKLFENFKNEELLQIVKDCFQDLLDEGFAEIADSEEFIEEYKSSVIICCTVPKDETDSSSFDSFYNQKKKHFDIISQIKNCLDRVRQAHTEEIDINFEYGADGNGDLQIDIYINEGSPESGEFWKIGKDGMLRLDFENLKEYLKLPKGCKISMSSTGRNKLVSIYFKSAEELESYQERVIGEFSSIKIHDKDLAVSNEWVYPAYRPEDKAKYKIYKNYNRHRSTGYYDNQKDIVHYIEFALNPELNPSW